VDPVRGPHRPLPATPRRRPGSVRRTTTTDTAWPDLGAGRTTLDVRGRDLVTGDDGTEVVADRFEVALVVELAAGTVLELSGRDASRLEALVGGRLRAGFGRHLAEILPDDGNRGTIALAALADLPGAFLVSGYALLRHGLVGVDPDRAEEAARRQADVCIGWATGSPVLRTLVERGRNAVPMGPTAPALDTGDPGGWHPVAALGPRGMRRRRQLDVWREDGGGVGVLAHLRDSYRAEDHEMALHEYVVEATVDADGRISAVTADPRTLPWAECPGATASAAGLVGCSLTEVAARVRAELVGPATCTHLSSTLRALADVGSLAAHLG
jgi:hypothetical protein